MTEVVLAAVVLLLAGLAVWQAREAGRTVERLTERHQQERASLLAAILVREGDQASAAAGGLLARTARPDAGDDESDTEPSDRQPVRVGDGWSFVGG